MSVSLTPDLELFVLQKVESGLYPSADEVLREALRLLDERDRLQARKRDELRWDRRDRGRPRGRRPPRHGGDPGGGCLRVPARPGGALMGRIVSMRRAKADLIEILVNLRKHNPQAADRFESDFEGRAGALRPIPPDGPACEDLAASSSEAASSPPTSSLPPAPGRDRNHPGPARLTRPSCCVRLNPTGFRGSSSRRGPMAAPRCRPFTLRDALILVAATAVGLAIGREGRDRGVRGRDGRGLRELAVDRVAGRGRPALSLEDVPRDSSSPG